MRIIKRDTLILSKTTYKYIEIIQKETNICKKDIVKIAIRQNIKRILNNEKTTISNNE